MRVKALSACLIVVSLLLVGTAHAAARSINGRSTYATNVAHYYALVIGNNAYTSLPKLKTAEADARAIEKMLHEAYGFQTKLLLNATRQQIIAALNTYRRELATDANLLLYYAGHGYNDKEAEKTYWLPVDASRDDSANWIVADEITSGIRAIPARHVLVVSDSCYSGTLTRGIGKEPHRAPVSASSSCGASPRGARARSWLQAVMNRSQTVAAAVIQSSPRRSWASCGR